MLANAQVTTRRLSPWSEVYRVARPRRLGTFVRGLFVQYDEPLTPSQHLNPGGGGLSRFYSIIPFYFKSRGRARLRRPPGESRQPHSEERAPAGGGDSLFCRGVAIPGCLCRGVAIP